MLHRGSKERRFGVIQSTTMTKLSSFPLKRFHTISLESSTKYLKQKHRIGNLFSLSLIIYYIHVLISIHFHDSISSAYIYFMIIQGICIAVILLNLILSILIAISTSISLYLFLDILAVISMCIFYLFDLADSYSPKDIVYNLFSIFRFFLLFSFIKFSNPLTKNKKYSVIPFMTNSERLISCLKFLREIETIKKNQELNRELLWAIDCICNQQLLDIEVQIDTKEQEEVMLWAMSSKQKLNSEQLKKQSVLQMVLDENLTDSVRLCLEKVNKLSFDIFQLKENTKGNELIAITYHLLLIHDYFRIEKINKATFDRFLDAIQMGYRSELPYHNSTHAADVVQAFNHFLIGCEIKTQYSLSSKEYVICILSAAIHDYQHPGKTNAFLINTKDDMAILYNDKSVLENYHVASSFKLLKEKELNILENLSFDDQREYRNLMIELVLATDFSKHFKELAKFKLNLKRENDEIKNDTKLMIMKTLMHASDISNSTRTTEIYIEWAQRVLSEFFLQGDEERKLGIPVSPLCDRNTVRFSKSQIGFIDMFVYPLFSTLTEVNKRFLKCMKNLDKNKGELENIARKENEKEILYTE